MAKFKAHPISADDSLVAMTSLAKGWELRTYKYASNENFYSILVDADGNHSRTFHRIDEKQFLRLIDVFNLGAGVDME